MNTPVERSWNTEHERLFINGLGAYAKNHECKRLLLLRRYQTAIQARQDWGQMNRFEVERHLIAAIEREVIAGA